MKAKPLGRTSYLLCYKKMPKCQFGIGDILKEDNDIVFHCSFSCPHYKQEKKICMFNNKTIELKLYDINSTENVITTGFFVPVTTMRPPSLVFDGINMSSETTEQDKKKLILKYLDENFKPHDITSLGGLFALTRPEIDRIIMRLKRSLEAFEPRSGYIMRLK